MLKQCATPINTPRVPVGRRTRNVPADVRPSEGPPAREYPNVDDPPAPSCLPAAPERERLITSSVVGIREAREAEMPSSEVTRICGTAPAPRMHVDPKGCVTADSSCGPSIQFLVDCPLCGVLQGKIDVCTGLH